MKSYQLLALFALEAIAAPKASKLLPAVPVPGAAAIITSPDIDPTVIGKTVFDAILDDSQLATKSRAGLSRDIFKRQSPANPPTISAKEASEKSASGGGKSGVFYRGDSRPPEEIFKSGFQPWGDVKSLQNHLEFKPGSGLVSLSRSPEAAQRYAFGRDKKATGYIYVIAPNNVPNGYWVPGIYPGGKNPAVALNQEFAVDGAVPGSSIAYAHKVELKKPSSWGKKIKNKDYALKSAPPCSKKRAICDPANFSVQPVKEQTKGSSNANNRRRYKSHKLKVKSTARAGGAIAFTVLAPYARDMLEEIKQWDNPIGWAVKWFDNAMTRIQEAIGGEQVPEIYGNELKLRIICWFRGKQQFKNDVDYACERLWEKDEREKNQESAEQEWPRGLNQLLEACYKLETNHPEDENVRIKLEDRCTALEAKVEEVEKGKPLNLAPPNLKLDGGCTVSAVKYLLKML